MPRSGHISAGEPRAHGEQAPKLEAEAGEPRARARCNRSANGSRVRYSVESNAQPTTRRSAHRRTCACLGIGYRARRESTHSAGQPRTYRPGSAQHVPTPHTGRSGEAERKTARGPACASAPRDLRSADARHRRTWHLPWTCIGPGGWLTSLIASQVSPVTEGAPHTVAHRHMHIADGSPA